jgi:ankyrin repeat protein
MSSLLFMQFAAFGMGFGDKSESDAKEILALLKRNKESDPNVGIILCLILEKDPRLANCKDDKGHTPLWHAVTNKTFWAIDPLLDYGAVPDYGAFDRAKNYSNPECNQLKEAFWQRLKKNRLFRVAL